MTTRILSTPTLNIPTTPVSMSLTQWKIVSPVGMSKDNPMTALKSEAASDSAKAEKNEPPVLAMGQKAQFVNRPRLMGSIEEADQYVQEKYLNNNWSEARRSTSYVMLFEDGDRLILYPRLDQPCYGEMRPYPATHPTVDFSCEGPIETSRPSDLSDPFPNTGRPIRAWYRNVAYNSTMLGQGLKDFMPWRKLNKHMSEVKNGLLLHDTHVDPTLVVSCFVNCRELPTVESFKDLITFMGFYPGIERSTGRADNTFEPRGSWYGLALPDLGALYTGEPCRKRPDWYDRGIYDRRTMDYLFTPVREDGGRSPQIWKQLGLPTTGGLSWEKSQVSDAIDNWIEKFKG